MSAYPELGLQDAREAWKTVKALLVAGVDLTTERCIEKLRSISSAGKTCEQVATEWRATKYPVESPSFSAVASTQLRIFSALLAIRD